MHTYIHTYTYIHIDGYLGSSLKMPRPQDHLYPQLPPRYHLHCCLLDHPACTPHSIVSMLHGYAWTQMVITMHIAIYRVTSLRV